MTLATAHVQPVTYDTPAQMATGTFTGDTSGAFIVDIGFTPKYVKAWQMSGAGSPPIVFEWCQGMAATDSITVVAAGTQSLDTGSTILANGKVVSTTETGIYAPGTQEPNDGTLINTTLNVFGIDKSLAYQLKFGANLNVNSMVTVWMALG